MEQIENDFLKVSSKPFGAELTSIFNKKTGLEYLWQAGEKWSKHAPVLFPIVGQLKNNIYKYKGEEYHLDRHGFARTKTFELHQQQPGSIEYILKSDDDTLKAYPFYFQLKIKYELDGNTLKVIYIVTNTGSEKMFFSIGAHPAFKVPLNSNENYYDYYLEFDKEELADKWMLNNGLLDNTVKPSLNGKTLPLKKSVFYEDALVFKKLKSEIISIKSKKHDHGLNFKFKGYPFFGIWAAKDADFVCLEPWHGVADNVESNQQFENKEGIISLEEGKNFTCNYFIEVF